MFVFQNKGLIDLEAIRLMGASVKKEGSFGRFGTGLKYAIASILRGGGEIDLHIGNNAFSFDTRSISIKGETFEEVLLVEEASGGPLQPMELGFTTALGRDWEAWMAIRELACNARDEGGSFELRDTDAGVEVPIDSTAIIVRWEEAEDQLKGALDSVFIPSDLEPLLEVEGVRIFPGRGNFIYYQGVRVSELSKPSAFRYDIATNIDLTEDRTARYSFIVDELIRRAILSSDSPEIIREAMNNTNGWEGSLNWTDTSWRAPVPGTVWLDTVADLREKRERIPDTAQKLLLEQRAVRDAVSAGGYYTARAASENYDEAIEALEELGVDIKPESVYLTAEMPEGTLSMVKSGRIYLLSELSKARPSVIAAELLRRHLEILSRGSHDILLSTVLDIIINASEPLSWDRKKLEEEKKAAALLEAEGAEA